MRTSAKLGLAALMAALLLSTAVSTASAGRFSISNLNFRVIWSRLEFQSSVVTLRCRVTLEGSFHSRTVNKRANSLIGAITRIDIHRPSCTGGTVRPSRAPPWHVTYEGFSGTLPTITSIRILLARFQFDVEAAGVTCRMGTATDNITGSATRNAAGQLTELIPVSGSNTLSLLEGSFFCPPSGAMFGSVGDGQVRLLGSPTTLIFITLI